MFDPKEDLEAAADAILKLIHRCKEPDVLFELADIHKRLWKIRVTDGYFDDDVDGICWVSRARSEPAA